MKTKQTEAMPETQAEKDYPAAADKIRGLIANINECEREFANKYYNPKNPIRPGDIVAMKNCAMHLGRALEVLKGRAAK